MKRTFALFRVWLLTVFAASFLPAIRAANCVVYLNSQTICAGDTITLTAYGSAGTYTWNTGASGNSITVSPSSTTTYSVTVTSGTCSATASATVSVLPPAFVDITGCKNICAGDTLTLTASGVGPFQWSNGATTQSITVSPSSSTTYTVNVNNGNATGPCPNNLPATVTFRVQAGFIPGAFGEPSYLDAFITGGTSLDGAWDAWCVDTDHQIFESETYTAGVYCTYGPLPPGLIDFPQNLPAINYIINQHYPGKLAADNQPFTYADVQQAMWTLIEDSFTSTGTTQPVQAHVDQIVSEAKTQGAGFVPTCGQYVALALVPQGAPQRQTIIIPYKLVCCNASASCTVNVNPLPIVNVNSETICAGGGPVTLTATVSGPAVGPFTYLWSNGSTDDHISVSPTSTTVYSVTVTSAAGCQSVAAQGQVTVNPLPSLSLDASATTICAGQSVTLTATTDAPAIQWSTGATTTSITVSPTSTTTYTVTVTGANGCTATKSVTIKVNSTPLIYLNSENICAGDTITLTAFGSAGTYTWSTGATGKSITVSPTVSTTYTVTVTTSSGCTASATATVTVLPPAFVDITGCKNVCVGESVTLTATGSGPFLWSNGATTQSITVSPSATTTYTVNVSSGNATGPCPNNLPATVKFNILPGFIAGAYGEPSYLDAFVSGGTSLDGAWDAWCVDTDHQVFENVVYNAAVYCTYGPIPGGLIDFPQNLPEVNYIINQHYPGKLAADSQPFTYADVQQAIWTLIEDSFVSTGTIAPVQAHVDQIVNEAQTLGVNFIPTCGQYVGLLLVPTDAPQRQTILIPYKLVCCNGSASCTVTVNPLPIVTVNNAEMCAGDSATLTATVSGAAVGPFTYLWSNGSTDDHITVSPAASATYTVTVTSAAGCQATGGGTVTVNPKPVVTVNNATICAGDMATLTAKPDGASKYEWSNGATTQSINVSPASTTTYSVKVTLSTGCYDTGSGTVTVNPKPVVTVNNATICAGDMATLTAKPDGASKYEWSNGATTQSINVSPSSTTTYSVKVTLSTGCYDTGSGTVTVNPKPVVTVNNATICAGEMATLTAKPDGASKYEWSNGATTQSINVSPSSTTTYSVKVTLSTGCYDTGSGTVTVNPKPTVTVDGGEICVGESITLTANATGATSYKWSTGETTQSITVSPTATTSYSVTVTSSANCTAYASATVKVNPLPTVSVNSTAICVGESATLTATASANVVSYLWSNGATTPSITVSPASTKTYTVTVHTAAGCQAVGTGTVTVNQLPTVTVNSATTCAGQPVTLTATASANVTSYLWSNGATTQSITVSPTSTTTYTVTVKTAAGCSDSDSGTVTVTPGGCDPGTFNFAGATASTGTPNIRTYTTANGVSVKVSGWSRTSTGTWAPAYVGAYSGGLGITDTSEDGTAPSHTVDNVGRDNYLLFEFSQPVVVKQAYLGYVTTDSDLSAKIGTFSDPYNNHITLSDAVISAFGAWEENAGGGSVRTAVLNAGGVAGNALIIAASLTDKVYPDQFKVQTLDICKPTCFIPVKIGDFVWNDVNKNGIQDAGEPGIGGVKLTLTGTSASGASVTLTTTTASNGSYLFDGLEPGSYNVKVDASNFSTGGALVGFTASPTAVGTNRAIDSNPNPTGTTPASLPGGSSDLTLDFGYYATPPPPPCVPTTFDFSGATATYGTFGNTKVYTVNGVSVRASAWSRDKTTGAWAPAYLGAYAGGLGVTDSSEGTGANNTHTVDNVGRDNYILFEFSQKVVVNRAYLGYVVGDSDMVTAIGTVANAFTSPQTLNDAYFSSFDIEENDTTSTTVRWADFNNDNTEGNVLVIGASPYDTTPDDYFKVQKLDICASQTPPPPTCVATTYDFSGSTALCGTAGNIRSYTVNGIGVKVSAFSRTSAGAWSKAYLGAYGGGLGVTDSSEGDGSGNQHTVDNTGGSINYVMFEFSQPVVVNRAYLGYVVGDSDLSVWVGNSTDPYNNHLNLSDGLLTGFGAREDNDTTLTTARWADFNATERVGNVLVIAASLSDTTPDDYFKIQKLEICANSAPPCPSPWTPKDIGNCTQGGSSSYNLGCYTLKGCGDDIWNSYDSCHFAYQPASGDCTVVARVTGVQNCDPWSKAGVCIRETLNGDSKHASMFITPGNGAAFQCRNLTGGSSSNSNTTGPCSPYWVKIVRSGSTFTGYYSTNGSTWTSCGSTTITMNSACYIGLCVTSHNTTSTCTATFDSVTATP